MIQTARSTPVAPDNPATALGMRLAEFRTQAFGALLASLTGERNARPAQGLADLFAAASASPAAGVTASGRNTALPDPESAYRMMSVINGREVQHKAEFAEMSEMAAFLSRLADEVGKLGEIDDGTADPAIREHLRAFVDTYNGWIDRFDEALASGGLLAGTQAASVSQWELEQSIENRFNGAASGLRGMLDLGLTIDPHSNLASLDETRLDAVLAENRQGALTALREFSANFARSAELLVSEGNFVPNRLDNLARAIHYIESHRSSLQAEFGSGDPARPTGAVAQALAAYEAMQS